MRLGRATVFAAACAAVPAAGHVPAGGAAIPPGVPALAYALNGRERGPRVVLGAPSGAPARWCPHRGESACRLVPRLRGAPGLPVPRRAVPLSRPGDVRDPFLWRLL